MTEDEEVRVLWQAVGEIVGEPTLRQSSSDPKLANNAYIIYVPGSSEASAWGHTRIEALRNFLRLVIHHHGPPEARLRLGREVTTEELLGWLPDLKAQMAARALGARS